MGVLGCYTTEPFGVGGNGNNAEKMVMLGVEGMGSERSGDNAPHFLPLKRYE